MILKSETMNKITLYTIYNQLDKSYQEYVDIFSDFMEIKKANDFPSVLEIIRNKNVYYFYNEKLKKKNSLKCKLIKFLNKRLKEKAIYKTFFEKNIKNNLEFNALILVHGPLIKPWIEEHYIDNIKDKILWYWLPMNNLEESKSVIKAILNNLPYSIAIDETYTGKIILLNNDDEDLIKCIKYKFPKANFYLRYVDATVQIDSNNLLKDLLTGDVYANIFSKIAFIQEQYINVVSYSKIEAEVFNIDYVPNRVNFQKLRALEGIYKNLEKIWFFAGNGSGKRFQCILNLVNSLITAKIKSKFIITNLNNEQKDQLINLSKDQIASPVFIDLFRLYPDEGYSYRLAEAFALNKNIISNRFLLKTEKFYNNSKIYLTDDFIISPDVLYSLYDLTQKYNEYINDFDINITGSIVDVTPDYVIKTEE